MLACEECGCFTEDGKGWVGHLSFDPDHPGSKKTLVLYCPICAAREFERVSPRLNSYT